MKVLFCRRCARKIRVGGQSSFIRVHAAQLKKKAIDDARPTATARGNTKAQIVDVVNNQALECAEFIRNEVVTCPLRTQSLDRYRSSASAMHTIRNQRVIKQATSVINMFPGRFFCDEGNRPNVPRNRHFFRGRLRVHPLDPLRTVNLRLAGWNFYIRIQFTSRLGSLFGWTWIFKENVIKLVDRRYRRDLGSKFAHSLWNPFVRQREGIRESPSRMGRRNLISRLPRRNWQRFSAYQTSATFRVANQQRPCWSRDWQKWPEILSSYETQCDLKHHLTKTFCAF